MCPVRAALPVNAVAMTFPPDPVWVRSAREAVRTAMSTAVPAKPELVDTAMLLTSEAVTNAVMASHHSLTPAPIGFRVRWTEEGALHVLVQDLGPGIPEETSPHEVGTDPGGVFGTEREAGTEALRGLGSDSGPRGDADAGADAGADGGRGLLLITREATDWGVCRHGENEGKSVWFSLG